MTKKMELMIIHIRASQEKAWQSDYDIFNVSGHAEARRLFRSLKEKPHTEVIKIVRDVTDDILGYKETKDD
jgi:hypothetical protein